MSLGSRYKSIVIISSLITISVVYWGLDFTAAQHSQLRVKEWLNMYQLDLQQGNILKAVAQNQRNITSQSPWTGLSVYDSSVKQLLSSVGKPIDAKNAFSMNLGLYRTGLFKYLVAKNLDGRNILLAQFSFPKFKLLWLFQAIISTFLIASVIYLTKQIEHALFFKKRSELMNASKNLFSNAKLLRIFLAEYPSLQKVIEDFSLYQNEIEKLRTQTTTREQELRISQKVAHDLRSPLSALQLATTRVEDVRLQSLMTQAIGRLRAITDDLLTKKTSLSPNLVGIKITTEIKIIIAEKKLVHNSISFEVEPSEELYLVRLSKSTFARIMSNIIQNSIDSMDSKGVIRVEVHHGQDTVQICVIDNGNGVKSDVLYLLNHGEPVTTKKDGNGIGFSSASAVLKEIGGKIKIENRQVGGAIVTVTLPVARAKS